jgi:hypothetical protein
MYAENARLQRRKKAPSYNDRMYDTTRAVPIAVERRLFVKLLQRRPFGVREAARLVAHLIRRARRGTCSEMGGLSGNSGEVWVVLVRYAFTCCMAC